MRYLKVFATWLVRWKSIISSRGYGLGVNLTDDDDRTTEEIIQDRKKDVEFGELEPSIVVPVNQAFSVAQKVLPQKQVLEILENAFLIGLIDCYCRDREKNCDAPLDVCIVVDSYAEKHLEKEEGKEITLEEAKEILERTAEAGLVHLSIWRKNHEAEAICSCCPCCCHELLSMLKFGNLEMVIESDYMVQFDEERCTSCGTCLDFCNFSVYEMKGDHIEFAQEKCLGCGLCVMNCPEEAVQLVDR